MDGIVPVSVITVIEAPTSSRMSENSLSNLIVCEILIAYFREGETAPSPDVKVIDLEETLVKALNVRRQNNACQTTRPERPGYGTLGKAVTLYTNHLPLEVTGKLIFRYHLDIVAEKSHRRAIGREAEQIVRSLLKEHLPEFQNSIATDYRSTLLSIHQLPSSAEYRVQNRNQHKDEYLETSCVYHVRCKYAGAVDTSDLMDYLTSTDAQATLKTKSEVLQVLNIILGHFAKTDLSTVSIGANKHYSLRSDSVRYKLGAGLESLTGFFVSARLGTGQLLLNVQVKHMACYRGGPLRIVIDEWQRANAPNLHRLEAFLKRLRVRLIHTSAAKSCKHPHPRIKIIGGLAAPGDGVSSQYPPKVPYCGAGPRQVQFFLTKYSPQGCQKAMEVNGRSRKLILQDESAPMGRYITVEEYFKQGTLPLSPKLLNTNIT